MTEQAWLLIKDLLYHQNKIFSQGTNWAVSTGQDQCSPQILAQQVRDHSRPVRQKICTRVALSLGEGGSGVRDMGPPPIGNLRAK